MQGLSWLLITRVSINSNILQKHDKLKKSIHIILILGNNSCMKNKAYKSYIIFTAVFFIFIALFIFFSVGIEYKKGQEEGYVYFNSLKGVITTAYLSADEFTSDPFKQRVNIIFSDNSALQSIIITDSTDQIEYLKARNSSIFASLPTFSNNSTTNPEYGFNKMLYSIFSDSIIIPGNNSFNLEIVYQIINHKNMLNALKFTISLILIYIVTTFFFLLFCPCNKVVTKNNRCRVPSAPFKNDHQPIAAKNYENIPKETTKPENQAIQHDNSALLATEFFFPKLTDELDKAASGDSDLTLTLIKYETDIIEKTYALHEEITSLIKSFFIKQIAFNLKNDTIAMILPDSTLEESITKTSEFIISLKRATGIENIFGGASSRNGRIVSASRIIMETESSLAKTLAESNSPIIAFKPNPEKYRQMISESASD